MVAFVDWTPIPHLTVPGSWHLLGLVLDVGLYVVALGALAVLILGMQEIGGAVAKGWREGYDKARRG